MDQMEGCKGRPPNFRWEGRVRDSGPGCLVQLEQEGPECPEEVESEVVDCRLDRRYHRPIEPAF